MIKKRCEDCQYFLQHYTLDNSKLYRVYCGHCRLSAVKRKRPDAAACDHFIEGGSETDRFVNKEYLTKALLHQVFNMELLPEQIDFLPDGKTK